VRVGFAFGTGERGEAQTYVRVEGLLL